MKYAMAIVMAVLFVLPTVRIGCSLQICAPTAPTTLLVSDGFGGSVTEPIRSIELPFEPVPLELPSPESIDKHDDTTREMELPRV
jgi:hypothetical protein